MNLSPRQSEIVDLARTAGRVSVEDLARRFAVTPQTIRKDLTELCARRILARLHGGACVSSGVENLDYEARRHLAADEKRAIGKMVAELIPDNCSLFINIGTTTEAVATALIGRSGLLVITNNLNVANALYPQEKIEVIIAGGPVRRLDGGVTGASAVDFIKQFKVDYAVIGASAIDEEGALLDFDYREVRVSQAIIENARHVILAADRLKFERAAPIRIGHLSQIQTFVTDKLPNPAIAALCQAQGVNVIECLPQAL